MKRWFDSICLSIAITIAIIVELLLGIHYYFKEKQ